MSEMRVVGVRVELPANQPILLLREAEGESDHVVRPNSDAMPSPEQAGDRQQCRERLPDVLRSRFDITVMAILAVLGFIVGATVVRDVRTAAHTRVVLPKPRRKEEARVPLVVARPAV